MAYSGVLLLFLRDDFILLMWSYCAVFFTLLLCSNTLLAVILQGITPESGNLKAHFLNISYA